MEKGELHGLTPYRATEVRQSLTFVWALGSLLTPVKPHSKFVDFPLVQTDGRFDICLHSHWESSGGGKAP